MPGSNLRYVAIIGVLIVALIAAWGLYPEQQHLTGNVGYQEQNRGYHAGGYDCLPATSKGLSDIDRKRRALGCEEAEEQHRLQTDDLIQQRRAADAADASAVFAFQQTRIQAWGVSLGIITMAAAIAAAWYARNAARAAKKALKHDKRVASDDLRPWLDFTITLDQIVLNHERLGFLAWVHIENSGRTPATNIHVRPMIFNGIDQDREAIISAFSEEALGIAVKGNLVLPGGKTKVGVGCGFDSAQWVPVALPGALPSLTLTLAISCTYEWGTDRKGQTVRIGGISTTLPGQGEHRFSVPIELIGTESIAIAVTDTDAVRWN
jgi:hypothetical protein